MNELPGLFRLAKNVSKHSTHKIKMGAVLVKHGRPLSVGFNKVKSHPIHTFSIHAEIDCMASFDREELRSSSMFIYRESKCGTPAIARPCKRCLEYLRSFGVKRIFFTTNEYPYWNTERIDDQFK